MKYEMRRSEKPRLHRSPDDPGFRFPPPQDEMRKRILANILASCEEFLSEEPPAEVPQLPDSPFPFHNLYLCFFNSMKTQAMMTQFAFAYLMTGEPRYGEQALRWTRALVTWDYRINTFYCSARVMHALAVAEDWLGGLLTEADVRAVRDYNAALCRFHEHEIAKLTGTGAAGGHSSLYTCMFGVAALSLLGYAPEAERWLDMALERLEREILPNSVSPDGTYPDGNWALNYSLQSRFLFMDALHNVTGINLFEKYADDVERCFEFLQYAYVGGAQVERKLIYGPDENLLTGFWQLDSFSPPLMKLAAVTRNRYAQWIAARDPNLGTILRTGTRVKMGTECVVGWGPIAYLWYDPSLEMTPDPGLPPSRFFPDGDYAVMRSSWQEPVLVAGYSGRSKSPGGSQTLVVHWDGRPLIKEAPAPNTAPLKEGNAPAMAGEMELMGRVDRMLSCAEGDFVRTRGFLTVQELALLRGEPPALLLRAASRRRSESEVRLMSEAGGRYVRLGEGGYLQYAREGNFCADGGVVRMMFRLRERPAKKGRQRILFGIGSFYYYGNIFIAGIIDGVLTLSVRDHEVKCYDVKLPMWKPAAEEWQRLEFWWSGFNGSDGEGGGSPRIGIACGGHKAELDIDLPTFTSKPNTSIWIGSSVQLEGSEAFMDVKSLEIYGPAAVRGGVPLWSDRALLFSAGYANTLDADIAAGSAKENAEGPLEFRMHPYERAELTAYGAELAYGHSRMRIAPVPAGSAEFALEPVPYAQHGYAGGSYEEKPERYTRLIARPAGGGSELTLAFVPPGPELNAAYLAGLRERAEALRAKHDHPATEGGG